MAAAASTARLLLLPLPGASCGRHWHWQRQDMGGVVAAAVCLSLKLPLNSDSSFVRFNGHAIYDLPNKVSTDQFGGAGRDGRWAGGARARTVGGAGNLSSQRSIRTPPA